MSAPTPAPAFTFDEATHTYRMANGAAVPSVTQCLEMVGFYDVLWRVDPEVLEKKRRIGLAVHKATELIESNRLDWTSIQPEWEGYLEAYGGFLGETGFKATHVEVRKIAMVHHMPVGMTIDRIGTVRYKGYMREAIGELKCTAQDEEYWGIQMAGYELGYGRPAGSMLRFAVQLKPDGKFKLHVYDDPAHHLLFVSALSLSWWKINHLKQYRNGFAKG